jgi:hypothetical protein
MQKLLRLTAAACSMLLVLGLTGSPADAADPALESQFVAGVNAVRAQAGLPPLQVHSQLTSVARSWADRQASVNAISHNPSLTAQVAGAWTLVGENVGTGPEVAPIMDAFVASPSHYANIVEPRFDFIGVGVTWGTDGRMYTTHVFMDLEASPAPAPAPEPASDPAPAPSTTAPAPTTTTTTTPPPPPPPPTPPPPAAAAPERVAVVLDMVGALGDGVQ